MSLGTWLYDAAYSPSAHVVEVIVRSLANNDGRILHILVDSGADGTILPIDLLMEIRAPYWGTRQMIGLGGYRKQVDFYSVTLQLGPQKIHGIRAIASASPGDALIGRDVLNQLRVLLDGPAETTEVME